MAGLTACKPGSDAHHMHSEISNVGVHDGGDGASPHAGHETETHISESVNSQSQKIVLNAQAGLALDKAYVKEPFPGRDVSGIFFDLINTGAADRLIGVETSLSRIAEIHTHIKDGNVMKMRKIDGVDLAADTTVSFEPGGYHIMVFKTELSPVATDIEMTLIFENAGETLVRVPIQGRPMKIYSDGNREADE